MPPRKKKIQPTRRILSSSSSSSAGVPDPSFFITEGHEEVQKRTRTRNAPVVADPDVSNIFNLQEQSPMKSPKKFEDDQLLATPVRKKKIVKLPVLSPLKEPIQAEEKEIFFFDDYRTYDFMTKKNERLLLIFELSGKIEGDDFYNFHKLIASLYKITSPENDEQLKWLQLNTNTIAGFESYDAFFEWFKDKVPYHRALVSKKNRPLFEMMIWIIRWIVQQLTNVLSAIFYLLLVLALSVYFFIRLGYLNDEMYAYFQVMTLLFYLVLDSFH